MKNCFYSIALVLILFLMPWQAQSQEALEDDEAVRNILDNRVFYGKYYAGDFFKEGGKWVWELDVVHRRQSQLGESSIFQEPLRFSVRPWVGYQASKLTRLSFQPFGVFTSAPRYPQESDFNRPFEREFRSTLQLNTYHYWDRVQFTHRYRVEGRWRGIDEFSGSTSFNPRLRFRIRTRIPLNADYFYENNTFYLIDYHEGHLEFGRNFLGTNYFSQNRNFLGIGFRFWDWARVELGYLYQLNFRGNNYDIDFSQGPMFYFNIDYLSKLRLSR